MEVHNVLEVINGMAMRDETPRRLTLHADDIADLRREMGEPVGHVHQGSFGTVFGLSLFSDNSVPRGIIRTESDIYIHAYHNAG